MNNIAIEESTTEMIPLKLREIIDNMYMDRKMLSETVRNDLFLSLLYVMMLECGFQEAEPAESGIPVTPKNWKTKRGTYAVKFTLVNVPDCPANLMVNPMEGAMLINLMLPNINAVTYSVCTPISRYIVSPFAPQPALIFRDLSDLSMKFKGSISYPAKSAILEKYGYVNASLTGIPENTQLTIFHMLGARELCSLAQTCKRLRDAVSDDVLWKKLFSRDFPSASVDSLPQDDWVGNYKTVFLKKKDDECKRNRFRNMHDLMNFVDSYGCVENPAWDFFTH